MGKILLALAGVLLVGCQLLGVSNVPYPESVEIGWTMAQVTTAMDGVTPDNKYVSNNSYGDYESWSYYGDWSSWTFMFKDGLVISISSMYH